MEPTVKSNESLTVAAAAISSQRSGGGPDISNGNKPAGLAGSPAVSKKDVAPFDGGEKGPQSAASSEIIVLSDDAAGADKDKFEEVQSEKQPLHGRIWYSH